MSTVALQPYDFPAKDVRGNFPAPLLYIGWEDHLMFCALATQVLLGVFGEHPDFARIDWSRAEWLKSGQPWTPDPAKSLADNGLGHKDVIRLRTPGLTGIAGSCA